MIERGFLSEEVKDVDSTAEDLKCLRGGAEVEEGGDVVFRGEKFMGVWERCCWCHCMVKLGRKQAAFRLIRIMK